MIINTAEFYFKGLHKGDKVVADFSSIIEIFGTN